MTADSLNNSAGIAETVDNFYSTSLYSERSGEKNNETYIDEGTGEIINIGSGSPLPKMPDGYKNSKTITDGNTFEIWYENQNDDFILYTNLIPINMQHLASAQINGEEVYILANALTKEEAEKILLSLVDN